MVDRETSTCHCATHQCGQRSVSHRCFVHLKLQKKYLRCTRDYKSDLLCIYSAHQAAMSQNTT